MKILKRIAALVLLAAVLVCSMGGCKADIMGSRTTMEFVRDMGIGINLGNAFDSTGHWYGIGADPTIVETAWGSPEITEEAIKGYAAAGFGVMRLPVTWSGLMDEDTGYIDPVFMDRVETVVKWILDSGMCCILNTHHDAWTKWMVRDYDKGMMIYENVWKQITERFEPYGEKLMFESMNEVGFDDIWNQYAGTKGKSDAYKIFNAMNQKFVDVVRSSGEHNAKRHILLASYWTSVERACEDDYIIPEDPAGRYAVSVHYYGPSTLTLISGDVSWGKAKTDWGSEEDYKDMNKWFDMLSEHFIDKGIPVIVGEFGCFGDNKTRDVIELWTLDIANAAYSRQICPILWDTPGDEYDRKECQFRRPEFIEKLVATAKQK